MIKLTKKMLEVESKLSQPLEKYLRRSYVDEHKTQGEIAKDLGVSSPTIMKLLNGYDIETRTLSESKLPHGFVKPSEEQLRTWYIDECKTPNEIAEEIGIGNTTINKWLNDYGIEIRTISESKFPTGFVKPSKKQLRTLYVGEHKTPNEIAEEISVSSPTVRRWLKDYGIEIRNVSESRLPQGFTKPSEERLKNLYIDEHKNLNEIAEEIGVSSTSVRRWLNDYGIEIRTASESRLPQGFTKPSEERLKNLYIDEHKNPLEIAEEFGVSSPTVRTWLKDYGIQRDKEELNELEEIVRNYLEND